ncbi:MAG: glutathione S-transferase family protein [Woeseiaceae bacterium]|nr:glutathione S-transferase family protein [Woeseiaceae bacterium]
MSPKELKVYGDSRSGNCYKIRLLCSELSLDYDWQEVDILAGETRTPQFLEMNPNGRIPLLELPDGRFLPESNAILYYLADGSELFHGDSYARAEILQWMFFEQYSHEPYIATSRFLVKYLGDLPEHQEKIAEKRAAGYNALDIMEQQLGRQPFMSGTYFNIADIALYAYTHVADEGGFELHRYKNIGAWMQRICERPNYVPMASQ